MFSKKKSYKPLRSMNDISSGDELEFAQESATSSVSNIKNLVFFLILSISIITNFVLALLHWPTQTLCRHENSHASRFEAGITRQTSVPWTLSGPFSLAQGREVADKSWANLEIDSGVIALSDNYVASNGLPEAMRFPWDDTKGVYFVNAYHNLHCLKKIYRALNEYDRNVPQSGSFPHIIHCLDALRQDTLCTADDTPRYAVMKRETPTGGGQYRQCRDWSQLEAWVKEKTACWRYVNSTDPNMDQLERFKYCPEGSPYLEKAREIYPDAGIHDH